jgi:tetratricopeptide (TPR) repeat protein
MDIERHLNGETVSARPDSLAYRLRKGLRRNWLPASAAATVLVAVLTGSGVAVVQAQRAAESAERERVVKAFVADVFRVNANVSAANVNVRPASARRLLEDGAALIETRFSGQLELQAELYGIVGDLCVTLGDYGLAASYASRRVETLSHLRPDHTQQAAAVLALASSLYEARRFADAEPRARHALELAPRDLALQAEALVILGGTHAYAGRLREARAALNAAQVKLAAVGNEPSISLAKLRARQGLLLVKENRMDLAIQHYRQGVDVALAAEGASSPAAAHARLHLAMVLFDAGQSVAAAVEQKHALDALTSLGGAHAARAAFERARFASWYPQREQDNWYEKSAAAIQGSRNELAHAAAPIPEWFVPQVNFWLGTLKSKAGDVATGLPLMEASFPLLYTTLDAPTDRFDQVVRFGSALMIAGRHELADRWLREVVNLRHLIGEGSHPWAAGSQARVATNLRMAGKFDEAQAILDSLAPDQTIPGTADPDSINRLLLFERVQLLLAQDNGRKALEALEQFALREPLHDARLADQASLLGESLCATGQTDRGLAALTRQMQADTQTMLFAHAPWLARSRAVAGLCALANGKAKEAQLLAALARAAFAAQPGVSPYFKAPLIKLERKLGLKLPPP